MDKCRASKQNAVGKTLQQITSGNRKPYMPKQSIEGKTQQQITGEDRGSDMFHGGEKNALELSRLATTSAGGATPF
jgi:hypothetical protein